MTELIVDIDAHIDKFHGRIVRCRDCKYFDKFEKVFPWCSKWSGGSITHDDGYCFMGERREDK